ncbi:hypothetical protein [Bradyrhizobium sp. STM 3561]
MTLKIGDANLPWEAKDTHLDRLADRDQHWPPEPGIASFDGDMRGVR